MATKLTPSQLDAKLLSPEMLAAFMIKGKQFTKQRDDLAAGVHHVNFTAHVFGDINIGEDQSETQDVKPSLIDLLAVLHETMSTQAWNKIKSALHGAYESAHEDGQDPEPSDDSLKQAKALVNALTRQESKDKRGSVSGTISVDLMT